MNTYKDKNNTCRCLPGFKYGDPVSKFGCFNCQTECHAKGYCAHPGKCVCQRGLVGDGITRCEIPTPEVTGIYPTKIRKQGYEDIQVTYYLNEPHNPHYIWCKFQNVTVLGELIEQGIVKCTAPPSNEYAVRVSLSFDTQNFSNSDVFIYYDQESKIEFKINWIVIAVGLIIFIWGNSIIFTWGKVKVVEVIDSQTNIELPKPAAKNLQNEDDFNPF